MSGVGGGCCCWQVGVCGVCRGLAVGCCVIGGIAVLGEGRVLAGGGFSSGWLGVEIRGGVGGRSVIGWASGWLVGGLLGWAFVWCG